VGLVDGSGNTNALTGLPVAQLELVKDDGTAEAMTVGKAIEFKQGASASVRRKVTQ